MLSILIKPPETILKDLGARAQAARLAVNWTRATLSQKSGVPEATIKRFETSGLIGTAALVDIAMALDMLIGLDSLFAPKPLKSLADVEMKKRKRGSV